jgi:VWFA-related protein
MKYTDPERVFRSVRLSVEQVFRPVRLPVEQVFRPVRLSVAAALLLSAGLWAQAPPPGQAQPPKTPPASTATQIVQPPTYRSGIDMVTTDVIVRDGRGQFVADLKPSDFEVLEDGVKQQVVQVLLFHGGRQYVPLAAPPPPQQEGIVLPPPRPTNDSAGRIFVFLVDDLHLDFRNTGRIRELFKKIRTYLVHEGDMFAIVSTGPSSIEVDMTYDMKRLDEAMKKIAGNALRPADILEGGSTTEGPSEVRYRAHVAFSTAFDLVTQLEQVHNRRKALIYVSNGYDFNPFPGSRYKAEQERMGGGSSNSADPSNTQAYANAADDPTDLFSRQGQVFAEADLARELAELTRAANRANVSFYTIDPRGLVGMPDLDETVDQSEWQDYIRKSQDSLIVLANETGGYAVVNSNDFDKALKRIDAETSDYYVLGYYSSNPDPLKRNRRIEVKLTRADLNIWSRKGYSIKSATKIK